MQTANPIRTRASICTSQIETMSEPSCELCRAQRALEPHKMEIYALVSAVRAKNKELSRLRAEVSAVVECVSKLTKDVQEHRARTAQVNKLAMVHGKKLIARIVKLEEQIVVCPK